MRITDGDTGRAAEVADDGALLVEIDDASPVEINLQSDAQVKVEDPDIAAALAGNLAFVSSAGTAGAGEEWLYIQNEDALDCVVERIVVSADAACHIQFATCTGTAAGTDITPVPGRLSTPIARSLEAKGDASVTGLTPGDVFWEVELAVGVPQIFNLELVLGQNDDFCVTIVDAADVAISVVLRWRP